MASWKRLALVALVLALVLGGAWFGAPVLLDLATRGRRLTDTSGELNGAATDFSIDEDPEDLAALAAEVVGRPVDVNAYALARMVRSEEPRESTDVKLLLAHVALNDGAAHGWTALETVTFSSVATRKGLFGNQTSRRYSTKDDPFEQDLAVAELAIDERGQGIDRAEGAVKFFDKGGIAAGGRSFDDVAASWAKEGLRPFAIAPAPAKLVFFRRGAA